MDSKPIKYKIKLHNKASKFLKKTSTKISKNIEGALIEISKNPFSHAQVKKMKGYKDTYRYRVGDYRIIYQTEEEVLTVLVLTIGSRGDVYK